MAGAEGLRAGVGGIAVSQGSAVCIRAQLRQSWVCHFSSKMGNTLQSGSHRTSMNGWIRPLEGLGSHAAVSSGWNSSAPGNRPSSHSCASQARSKGLWTSRHAVASRETAGAAARPFLSFIPPKGNPAAYRSRPSVWAVRLMTRSAVSSVHPDRAADASR